MHASHALAESLASENSSMTDTYNQQQMKPTVFNERVATALKSWHHTAKKQIKHGRTSESTTPFSSRPTTPTHGSSPIHLLRNAPHKRSRSVDESFANSMSPRNSDFDSWDPESQHETAETSNHRSRFGEEKSEKKFVSSSSVELPPGSGQIRTQHELNIFRFINDAALVHFSIRDLSPAPEALFSQCKTMEILDSKTMEIHGKLLKCGFLSLGLFAMSGFESLRKMC